MWDLNSSSATTSGFKALERGNNETHRIKSQDTPSEGDIRFPCEVTGSPHNDAFIRTETQPRQCTENIKIEKGCTMCLPRVHISPVYVRYDEVKAFGVVSLPNINIISQVIPQTC